MILILQATAVVMLLQLQTLAAKEIRLGALIPWNGTWPAGPRMASAILIAIDKVKEMNLLPGYNISYVWRDSQCQTGPTLKAVADMWSAVPRVDTFIGSACSIGCVPCAHLAAHWNIPVISYGCNDDSLSDKTLYPTFARTVSSISKVSGDFVLRLMKRFKWDRIALFTSTETVFSQIASRIKEVIETEGNAGESQYEVSYFQSFTPSVMTDSRYKIMLESAKKKANSKC